MSTVFIVFTEDYDAANDTGIEGVFSTRRAADDHIAKLQAERAPEDDVIDYAIGEWEVDLPA